MLFLIPTLEVKEKSADLSLKNEQKGWKQVEHMSWKTKST